ncbi:50S ribosomal protein L10 [Endozoicomonas montiporae]|uniref:Large ribosomal subunit protein uL10 n=2 Tax=Endozoicomonas montiporae TaxID=1027273 RepID=A0A081N259_9GAMM|nr:50S ribosomal protein L10 [Endozoicomonas montiporae]AMO58510.1 50S ribosomal protein L10 [Endozoicomonas montiporae CL-33]KEQ12532.1 50S ribosomal protein L10 [Endozoicomonas montiporae]
MALGLEDKKAIVAEVSEAAQSALSAVIADYRGLTVGQMTELRKQARDGGVYLKVVRNTLARRAVEGTEFECLQDVLVGPTVLAFSQEDPGAAARLMKDFAKENKELEVKALSIAGQVLGAEQIDVLAKMPTLDQARAMLMSVMIAPVTKLARTLNEFPASITRVVAAVADEKKKAA